MPGLRKFLQKLRHRDATVASSQKVLLDQNGIAAPPGKWNGLPAQDEIPAIQRRVDGMDTESSSLSSSSRREHPKEITGTTTTPGTTTAIGKTIMTTTTTRTNTRTTARTARATAAAASAKATDTSSSKWKGGETTGTTTKNKKASTAQPVQYSFWTKSDWDVTTPSSGDLPAWTDDSFHSWSGRPQNGEGSTRTAARTDTDGFPVNEDTEQPVSEKVRYEMSGNELNQDEEDYKKEKKKKTKETKKKTNKQGGSRNGGGGYSITGSFSSSGKPKSYVKSNSSAVSVADSLDELLGEVHQDPPPTPPPTPPPSPPPSPSPSTPFQPRRSSSYQTYSRHSRKGLSNHHLYPEESIPSVSSYQHGQRSFGGNDSFHQRSEVSSTASYTRFPRRKKISRRGIAATNSSGTSSKRGGHNHHHHHQAASLRDIEKVVTMLERGNVPYGFSLFGTNQKSKRAPTTTSTDEMESLDMVLQMCDAREPTETTTSGRRQENDVRYDDSLHSSDYQQDEQRQSVPEDGDEDIVSVPDAISGESIDVDGIVDDDDEDEDYYDDEEARSITAIVSVNSFIVPDPPANLDLDESSNESMLDDRLGVGTSTTSGTTSSPTNALTSMTTTTTTTTTSSTTGRTSHLSSKSTRVSVVTKSTVGDSRGSPSILTDSFTYSRSADSWGQECFQNVHPIARLRYKMKSLADDEEEFSTYYY